MKRYRTIMADPPWAYPGKGCWQRPSSRAASHYGTLEPEEIAALPVEAVAAEEAVLWLWVPNHHLVRGLHLPVVEGWGFRPMCLETWCKVTKDGSPHIGLGKYLRNTTEHCLFCVCGTPDLEATLPTHFSARKGGHSEKPEEFVAGFAETAYRGPRLELFAREERDGWDAWGNEVGDLFGWTFEPEDWSTFTAPDNEEPDDE